MLEECALVPDIFDSTCYSSPELCDIHLGNLKEYLLQEALVRDLREGEWSRYVSSEAGRHPRAKELMKKLVSQRRLHPSVSAVDAAPVNCIKWCQEALASHDSDPLAGIIASSAVAREFHDKALVASIEKISNSSWWQARSPSRRLYRTTSDYLQHLRLVLSHANSLMFIDPHLDPTRNGYSEFIHLLRAIQRSDIAPSIEIHRACYIGSGPNRKVVPVEEWEQKFLDKLDTPLKEDWAHCGSLRMGRIP